MAVVGFTYLTHGLVLLQIILVVCTIKASTEQCEIVYSTFRYPFGIGEGCYFDKNFEIVWDHSSGSSKAILKSVNLTINPDVTLYGGDVALVAVNVSVFVLNSNSSAKGTNLIGSPFSFSQSRNRFVATGCDNYPHQNNSSPAKSTAADGRCLSVCTCDPTLNRDCCDLCCDIDHPNSKVYDPNMLFNNYSRSIPELQECTSVSMVFEGWFFSNYEGNNPIVLKDKDQLPVVLEWGKYKGRCYEEHNSGTIICNKDNKCLIQLGSGYYCRCDYTTSDTTKYLCEGDLICITTSGHNCSECPPGYDPTTSNDQQLECFSRNSLMRSKTNRAKSIVIGCVADGLGMWLLVTGAWWLDKFGKRRRETKLKQKFFKQNGGLLLQQELASIEGNIHYHQKTKLFSSDDLEKATDNFNINRILGQGGQGTVYKAMLDDGKIVAIKRSKVIDESKVGQFINEVVILSQINHRNVVKLVGCCLETEVPLLVYEFIPNGTLFRYIHDHQNEELPITWEMRLCIAVEVSGALSYLHSAASIPIFHRDIKSANILLDDRYRAKVSDFGASRSVEIDQTHTTTKVIGTFGYMDPEYFRSSQFTEKSDVYSFGVVLAELLTGETPIRKTNFEEDKSLAAYFLCAVKEDRLFEILGDYEIKEGDRNEILTVARLTKRCLNLNGKKRPTMKEVASELAGNKALNIGA